MKILRAALALFIVAWAGNSLASDIDLSHWKLTLPVSKNSEAGKAREILNPGGFSMSPYFVPHADGITFSASVGGALTPRTRYPRTELREMSGKAKYSWRVAKGGTLSATLRVDAVPQLEKISAGALPAAVPLQAPGPGRIVVGQIEGPRDELCRLYYDRGVLYFNDDKSGAEQTQKSFALKDASGKMTNIPLGKTFSYTIDANATQLTVSAVVDGQTYTASEPIGPFWPKKPLYFKAGAYIQVNTPASKSLETGTGTGTVTFSSIVVRH